MGIIWESREGSEWWYIHVTDQPPERKRYRTPAPALILLTYGVKSKDPRGRRGLGQDNKLCHLQGTGKDTSVLHERQKKG